MGLEATELKTFISNFNSGNTLGYGSIIFNETIKVTFTIMKATTSGNIFVSWPSKRKEGGDDKVDYFNYVSFTTPEIKKQVDDLVLKDFNKKYLAANGGKINSPKVIIDKTPSGSDVSQPAIEQSVQDSDQTEKPKKKMIWRS